MTYNYHFAEPFSGLRTILYIFILGESEIGLELSSETGLMLFFVSLPSLLQGTKVNSPLDIEYLLWKFLKPWRTKDNLNWFGVGWVVQWLILNIFLWEQVG